MSVCLCLLQLRYTFAKYMLLQEPLLVVTALFCLFLLVIIYVRMDFAISKVLPRVELSSDTVLPCLVGDSAQCEILNTLLGTCGRWHKWAS